MELFVVNRYLGEDSKCNGSTQPDNGLEKLLKKIEERKRLRLQDDVNNEPESSHAKEDYDEKHKKKKAKRKRESSLSELEESVKEKKTKKQKNKKDSAHLNGKTTSSDENEVTLHSDNESSTNIITSEITDININSIKKKKTKKVKRKEALDDSQSALHEQGELGSEETSDAHVKLPESSEIHESDIDETNIDGTIKNNDDDDEEKFTVIGGHNFKQKSTVKRLPEWLANPILITGSFKDKSATVKRCAGLDKVLTKNLKQKKIKYLFPVQQTVIPWLLKETMCSGPGLKFWPRDICVCTPTGSGKTLAYVIPIIQHLKKRFIRRIGALVVVPVQDLASQVAKVFSQYTVGTGLNVLSVTGKSTPFKQEQKSLVYNKPGYGYVSLVDIMVTTPGRLVEHIKETPGFSLHHLKFLVIDEADRVIDNIKNDWLYHLENHISSGGIGAIPPLSLHSLSENPPRPQKLLFSATLTHDPEKLKQVNLFQPRIFVAKHTDKILEAEKGDNAQEIFKSKKIVKPVELEEQWIKCNNQLKPLILYHILATKNWRGVLCFTHFTDAAHQLTLLLRQLSSSNGLNLKIEDISSDRKFNDRSKILDDFSAGKVDVLVCSDIYARGIDISEVHYVVLYSPPVHSRNYIHQVGRTARAGMTGTAVTFVTDNQVNRFHNMLKGMGQSNLTEIVVPEKELSYLGKTYKQALNSLKKETTREKKLTGEETKTKKRGNSKQFNVLRKRCDRKKKKIISVKGKRPKIHRTKK